MEECGILRMVAAINESGSRIAEIVSNMLSFALRGDAAAPSHDPAGSMNKTLELAATDYN